MALRVFPNPWTVPVAYEKHLMHTNSSLLCGTGNPSPTFGGIIAYFSAGVNPRPTAELGDVLVERDLGPTAHPVGKSYASIVDDEKMVFEQGRKHRQYGHKKSATYIIAVFTDMDGQRGFTRCS